jgi:HEPN domain-containing protein
MIPELRQELASNSVKQLLVAGRNVMSAANILERAGEEHQEEVTILAKQAGGVVLDAADDDRWRSFNVRLYLYHLVIELYLKAFLVHKKSIIYHGHDIVWLYRHCISEGLQLAKNILDTVVTMSSYSRIRYPFNGAISWSSTMKSDLDELCKGVLLSCADDDRIPQSSQTIPNKTRRN